MHFISLFFLAALYSKALFVKGQEDDVEIGTGDSNEDYEIPAEQRSRSRETAELLDNLREPSPNVESKTKMLLTREGSKICPGDVVSLLIGFENNGSKTFYVTDIVAAMTAPYEPTQYFRNYSAMHHNISVRSNEIHTFEYAFKVDPRINPYEYGVVAVVFYHDSKGNEYSTVVANMTLPVSDAPGEIGTRSFLIIVALIVAGSIGGYMARESIKNYAKDTYTKIKTKGFKKPKKKNDKSSKSPSGSYSPAPKKSVEEREQDSWLSGTNSQGYKKTRKVSASPAKSSQRKDRGRSPAPSPLGSK
ncbi:putative translocon-associated protein subunit alpha [Monocercomonoides exilis]|uniref:putative translocon-associated protein subunit alpha n=1 Tax=Monocercomonoides exilis TaxID=2049356 RepID=UPI00355970EF|nr:putative translocon-associated protein subunit alpha [Monocercomonoides exilis]|eukprot:MONOS_3199.1-p1 / transcript=MONOS_3199.1 / gene=MONOS_3199 / organism=Monocercomonoides_exilis_PA203 / gene_product=unspecified product / transcript_product=unspecified product / location=Mono_scaffold00073:67078-68117(-) / protein_length=303 / sequence_SO=supercontig / SO=protein_coding / is_pseudo=false